MGLNVLSPRTTINANHKHCRQGLPTTNMKYAQKYIDFYIFQEKNVK